jgi:hypothetical protein
MEQDDKMQVALMDSSIGAYEPEIVNALQSFQKALSNKPKKVITEQIGGQTFQHIPIAAVENTLKKYFFGLYSIEIVNYSMIVNEITVHVRLKVFHPILRQWLTYDGLSAVPVQQDAGSRVNDFMQTKKKDALHKNLPAAYAFALKNAAKKIGPLFGSDLNRKHEDGYVPFTVSNDALNK